MQYFPAFCIFFADNIEKTTLMRTERKSLLFRLFSGILALLGFASCIDPFVERCEYGCPTTGFQAKGTVTDEAGTPVSGIRVILTSEYKDEFSTDTVFTDTQGNFKTKRLESVSTEPFFLVYDDVDGEANGGEFLSDTTSLRQLTPIQTEKGDGRWYEGEYVYTDKKALKKKP